MILNKTSLFSKTSSLLLNPECVFIVLAYNGIVSVHSFKVLLGSGKEIFTLQILVYQIIPNISKCFYIILAVLRHYEIFCGIFNGFYSLKIYKQL